MRTALKAGVLFGLALAFGAIAAPQTLFARVVGELEPSRPLTPQRIAALPAKDRQAWRDYWQASEAAAAAGKAAHDAEAPAGEPRPPAPVAARQGQMPLDRESEWYGTPEARAIADSIVSFQMPSGGWYKTQPRNVVRARGQSYAADGSTNATIDNDATTNELWFLARVIARTEGADRARYAHAFERGVEYLLNAQYPNGGWPQIYPLQGGYHDNVTFNDDAMIQVTQLLGEVADASSYAFVRASLRTRAGEARDAAIDCILRTQITTGGVKTIWAQQYDMLTLTPASARNFEPTVLSTSESAAILSYLMTLNAPSPQVIAAVRAGVAHLKKLALADVAWRRGADGFRLVPEKGAPLLWARYYTIGGDLPVFGDRDKKYYDSVDDISDERRNGYAWYGTRPTKTLAAYERWEATISARPR